MALNPEIFEDFEVATLREGFLNLKSTRDLANLLGIRYSSLVFHIYKTKPEDRYVEFTIAKKGGGVRTILAPSTALKLIQRKLSRILYSVYEPKASTHGFVQSKSIVTNSLMHKSRRFVLNIDLKDFFPSINFGRVRGMFMALPYFVPEDVATVLAQICNYSGRGKDELPQGAPTSPIITNMLCAKLDSNLRVLSKKVGCTYTRYVDDITFSTSHPEFPPELAKIAIRQGVVQRVVLGKKLNDIIYENGFEVNKSKIRLQTRNFRQEVTGLTVNQFPNVSRNYVRQIRTMIHAWRKYTLPQAEEYFLLHHDQKHRGSFKRRPKFEHILRGRIDFLGMVRGRADLLYLKYLNEYRELIGEKLIYVPTPDNEIRSLGTRMSVIEREIDLTIVPYDFGFLSPPYQKLLATLEQDSVKARRARSKDDFPEFCRWILLLLESGTKGLVNSNHADSIRKCMRGLQIPEGAKREKLDTIYVKWLIQICTEYRKDLLLESGFISDKVKYYFHDTKDPYSNPYQILHYVRELRNFVDHREGNELIGIIQRIDKQIELLNLEIAQLQSTDKRLISSHFNLQTMHQLKPFLGHKNYDAIENAVHEFLRIILVD